jgi:type II secretory pathway component GspD/PulD (secretin)
MVDILKDGAGSGDGDVFRDEVSNMIYWKDSASDGRNVLKWLKNLDRPVPQIELTVKVYTVRESDLRDIGIDFLAWENGPGLEIFGLGFDSLNFKAAEKIFSGALQKFADIFSNMSYAFGGFYTAPQFDARFVRCLPWLKDIPFLGWIFSTETESTKKSQLVLVAECTTVRPNTPVESQVMTGFGEIREDLKDAGDKNSWGFKQYMLDKNKSFK